MQISVKFLEKRKSDQILIGLWKYFAISKRFSVNYKEFPENYSGNFKLTLGKFLRIEKN